MNRNSDPHFNLADALSEDILDASAEGLVAEAAHDGAAVAAFDRIAARAERQARWRRFAGRLHSFVSSLVPPAAWRPALVAVAGVAVVVVAGDLYVHLRPYGVASSPPPAAAIPDSGAARDSIAQRNRLAYSEERGGEVGNGASAVPASVAPPAKVPDALPAPPAAVPAPPAAASAPPAAAEAPPPKRVRTVEIRASDSAAPPTSEGLLSSTPAERRQARADYERAQRMFSTIAREKAAAPQPPPAAAASAPKPTVAVAAAPGPTADSNDNLSFDWPLRGRLIRNLGPSVGSAPSPGIDIAAPLGTDIRAAEAGVVVYAGNELKTYGNMILVRHSGGFVTAYAHASRLLVKVNDPVRRGQVIAKSGQTGSVTSPQLHFEMRKGATAVDPLQYLPKG
jgi:murein DD-endopeptidase MepM/ murein hydrolase activator NlpD